MLSPPGAANITHEHLRWPALNIYVGLHYSAAVDWIAVAPAGWNNKQMLFRADKVRRKPGQPSLPSISNNVRYSRFYDRQ